MTYSSRGRTIKEIIAATIFVSFLVGFVGVLCVGNYFRAKRAMERQKQRRLARLSEGGGNGIVGSPKSYYSTSTTSSGGNEQMHLLSRPLPDVSSRRRVVDDSGDLLQFTDTRDGQPTMLMSV
jgi:hypothetical protein